MSKYRIDATGITDGISNLNINLAENNNFLSSSKDVRISYSTKQTFIDIHVEDGEIVDKGNCAINNSLYNLTLASNVSIINNDNTNKRYDQVIYSPSISEYSVGVETKTTASLFSKTSYSILVSFKILSWPSNVSDLIAAGATSIKTGATSTTSGNRFLIRNIHNGSTGDDYSYINTTTSTFYDIYNKLGEWCEIIVSFDEINLLTNIYLNRSLFTTKEIKSPIDHILIPRGILIGHAENIQVEYLKVISGIWTPEDQIDLE